MPKKQRKLKLGLRRILPALIFVLVGSSVAFYGTTQVKPSHADTAAYYSCNSGDSLSGSTCTHTTTYPTTYTTNYSCPRGGSASGGTCYYSGCPSGTSSNGTDCISTYSGCQNWPGSVYDSNQSDPYFNYCMQFSSYDFYNNPCPAGTYKWNNACYTKHAPVCNSGDTFSYGTCTHRSSPNCGSDSVSGTTCYYGATATTDPGCGNGGTWNGSSCTSTSTYTATYHPATTSGSGTGGSTGGSTSSGGSTGGGSTTKKSTSTTTTKSSSSPVTITPAQPPSAPANLGAEVKSSKVVELKWSAGQAAAGIQNYEIQRSLDSSTWVSLGVASDTAYTDSTTDFATKYYYRVREVDNTGADSDYATVAVTTGKFQSTSDALTSDDKLVTVSIPAGSFDRPVSCSITSPDGQLPSVQGKSLLIGPYYVLCIDPAGTTIATFKKPLSVSMDLSGASSGYSGFEAQLFDNSSSSAASGVKFDSQARHLVFQLASDKSFAAYGKKQGLGLAPFLLVLVLIVGVGGALYLRRYWGGRSNSASLPDVTLATMPVAAPGAAAMAAAAAAPNAQSFFEQAVNKPNCTHLNMAHRVQPQTSGCAECVAEHKKWNALRICLTCGHVGCSDDSEEQHALKHYQQTGHPLIYEYANPKGDSIGWCYIDQTYI